MTDPVILSDSDACDALMGRTIEDVGMSTNELTLSLDDGTKLMLNAEGDHCDDIWLMAWRVEE